MGQTIAECVLPFRADATGPARRRNTILSRGHTRGASQSSDAFRNGDPTSDNSKNTDESTGVEAIEGSSTDRGDDADEQECLIVEIRVPTDALPLGKTLARLDVRVEFEQVVPSVARPLQYLWTSNGNLDAFEEAAGLLANSRRRHAIERLRSVDGSIGLADLADEVATVEHGTIISEIPAEEVKRVHLDLYHSHVPKLTKADVVEYSQEADRIGLSVGADRLTPYLEAVRR